MSRAQVDPVAMGLLASGLRRYVTEAERATAEARRCETQVSSEIHAEIGHRRARLANAEGALSRCLQIPEANCSAAAAAVRQAQERLQAAQQASRILNEAGATFAFASSRFGRVTGTLVRDSLTILGVAEGDLATYLNQSGISRSSSVGESGGSSGGRPIGAGGTDSSATRPAGFPEDMELIPIDLIDDGEHAVQGPEDFGKGYSPEDLRWGFEALNDVVLPAIRRGKGIDYFRERDQVEGLLGTRSYAMTYDGFFVRDQAPVVSRLPNGRYLMDGNGRHRLWVARTSGAPALPARVEG